MRVLALAGKGSKMRSYSVENALSEALDKLIEQFGEVQNEDQTDEQWRLVSQQEVSNVDLKTIQEPLKKEVISPERPERSEPEEDLENYAAESRLLEEKLKDELHVSFSSDDQEQEQEAAGSQVRLPAMVEPAKPAPKEEEAVEKKKGLVLTGQRKLKPKNK